MLSFKNILEKQTFKYFLLYSIFDGIGAGVLVLSEIVAKKTIGAANIWITIIIMLAPVTSFLSVLWSDFLEASPNKSKIFLYTGIFTRFLPFFIIFTDNIFIFCVLLGIFYAGNSIILPAINSIISSNFDKSNKGKFFGFSTSIKTIVGIIVSLIAGKILDVRGDYFRLLFSLTGICGFLAAYFLSLIKYENDTHFAPKFSVLLGKTKNSLKSAARIMYRDRDYRIFQVGFLLYGMGFISMVRIIPDYVVNYLNLSYSQFSFAKSVIGQIGIILCTPLMGKILDRTNPFKFNLFIYISLIFYPLCLSFGMLKHSILSPFQWLIIGYFIFGIAMAGIVVSWNIASIHFTKCGKYSSYQAVHVSLTGVRGLLAPLLAQWVLARFGIMPSFVMSMIFFTLASIVMFYGMKNNSLEN